jgi:hypothetical protein
MTLEDGRRSALTFPTTLRRGGSWWLRVLFGAVNRLPPITAPLRRMEVIHVARWAIVTRLPGAGGRLPRPMLLSLFDYDGDLLSYIDVFAAIVPRRFRAVWSTSHGYPGLIPTDGFSRFVREVETVGGHYYAAVPAASTTMVGNALLLQQAFRTFLEQHGPERGDDDFAAAFTRFVAEVQQWL